LADNDATKAAANREFRKARAAEDGKRAMIEYENAAVAIRAKTAKLRALRLAREAELAKEAEVAPAKKKAPKKS
jgi:hypothetical protein